MRTRNLIGSVLYLSATAIQGFTPLKSISRVGVSPLYSSVAKDEDQVPLVIEGKNLEITEALYSYVDKRIRSHLEKLSGQDRCVKECDVILSVSKNPKVKNKHRVEVVTNLKGTTIICTNESPDMYTSIDAAANALYRKLLKYKERRMDGWHGGEGLGDDIQAALDAMEEQFSSLVEPAVAVVEDPFVDPEAPTVTKINSFQLDKPISLQEAIFALDYVDHDFYVFRNDSTNKINVVYKRHGGGIGWIEP